MKKIKQIFITIIAICILCVNFTACSVENSNSNGSGSNSNNGIWKISYYVDEFNNPTTDAYITNKKVFTGTFSNSATTNSNLNVRILIDNNGIAVKMYEYGSLEIKAYSTMSYNVTYLEENGNRYNSTGIIYENGDRINLEDNKLIDLLSRNEKIKIHMEEVPIYGGYKATYLFEVKNDNLTSLYSEYINS